MSSYSENKNMSLKEINAQYSSPEAKRKYLQEQMVKRIAAVNGANNGTKGTSMTVDELVNYGNNAYLLNRAANGESVTLSTPRTDYLAAMKAGDTPSSAYYSTLSGYALGNKNASYAMAEKARRESEALAEIQRKRSIVDASTMAEQQKATYGANAEQVGRMGLQVSGYSDYLNSQAYAAGMAGRQAANAQATDANRKALYTEQMAKLEADKEYNNALAQIETAKYNEQKELEERNYAEQKEKEAQQQTNYMALLEAISNGSISKDDIGTYASALGITDSTLIDNATTYAGNMVNTSGLETSLAANEANKDFISAAVNYVDLYYPDATDEQKKTFQASYIVGHIGDIDDSDLAEYAKKINNGDYGTAGGESIKKAVSQIYIDSADSLSKERLKTVIDSGILTTEAQSKLEAVYGTKYADKEQTSIYNTDVFGKYSNPDKVNAEQSNYVDAIINAAKNGKLSEGDIVAVVLGTGTQAFYKYTKNGNFEKVKNITDVTKLKPVNIDGYTVTLVHEAKSVQGVIVTYSHWTVTKNK